MGWHRNVTIIFTISNEFLGGSGGWTVRLEMGGLFILFCFFLLLLLSASWLVCSGCVVGVVELDSLGGYVWVYDVGGCTWMVEG